MLHLTRSRFKRYGVAILAVLVALLLTQLLWHLHKMTIYPLFLAAVMVSAWYGGLEPGLLATVMSALVCAYFYLPPLYSLAVSGSNKVGLVQFLLVALAISFLNGALHSARRLAEINAREAQRNYEQLRQSQESLRQSEERYRLFVEGAREYAIFMLDMNGNIVSWNMGAERILGYQEAEIIGQPFEVIFTPESVESGLPQQVLSMAEAEGFSRENRWHVRKDGTHFWAYCAIALLQDEDGNRRGFSKIMQDISERRQAEEEREQLLRREQAARAIAEAANRSKDDFLAIVSHELRTPMTAIAGWASMLQTGQLDEERAALAIETIERNANLQMQLIEDLLDVSRIVRGELSLNFGSVDLVAVITAAIEILQSAADAKAIDLRFTILDDRPESIATQEIDNNPNFILWGDSDRLQQVVLNLLSNAIKFTPNGGQVELELSAVTSDNRENSNQLPITNSPLPITNSAQITVSDTGKGISSDFLPYVFDRFRQADSTSTRSNKGLGLGLAIARHLVELHGGTITAESPGIGQGATFTVNLPFRSEPSSQDTQATNANPMHAVELDNPTRLDGLRVLVVDDETDAREWIRTVLQDSGAEVILAASVGEALEALQQSRPDVLVSDIGMPGEDGYALMRKIREMESVSGVSIPAVALTGYARVEDYREALAAGFQLHVAKPVRAAELIAVVASLGKMSGKL